MNEKSKDDLENEKKTEGKRKRLPPLLSDIVYIALLSDPKSGKDSNFEVLAISMSDYSIIKLKYSRKTKTIKQDLRYSPKHPVTKV